MEEASHSVWPLGGYSDRARGRLEVYVNLLERWNSHINLVSRSSVEDVWMRHIADSAQVLQHIPEEATHFVDMGPGGGFPGLVVAILAAERPVPLRVSLIEADHRKATFLETVSRETNVVVNVVAKRIEQADPLSASVVSARALAPLIELCGFAERHLALGGIAIFLKGQRSSKEIEEARVKWRFDLEEHPSATGPGGTILKLKELSRV